MANTSTNLTQDIYDELRNNGIDPGKAAESTISIVNKVLDGDYEKVPRIALENNYLKKVSARSCPCR